MKFFIKYTRILFIALSRLAIFMWATINGSSHNIPSKTNIAYGLVAGVLSINAILLTWLEKKFSVQQKFIFSKEQGHFDRFIKIEETEIIGNWVFDGEECMLINSASELNG